ncbi:MAG: ABC transporter substrate-binding protein [Clostridia bacterium]|nr:ABC transporter substrate-binding protein [Clostridia bacterium]
MKKTLAMLAAVMMLLCAVASAETYTEPEVIQNPVGGSITIPVTDAMDANFEEDSYGGGSDGYSSKLIHAYNLAVTNRDGQLVINPMVVESMETTENNDGSKTYTITLHDDLYFNDGTQITAMNYIAYPMLFTSPIGIASGAYGTAGKYFVGYEDFKTGANKVFTGIRLLDTLKFSYTISAENTPFYYELNMLNCSQYSKCYPLDWETWCPGYTIKDDGEGCYIVEDEWYDATNTELASAIGNTRFAWDKVRTDGPYYLSNVDLSAQVTELQINPYYKGNYAGYKPSIEKITIVKANQATLLDSLKTGEIDWVNLKNQTGATIDAALDLVDSDSNFSEVHYMALYYGKIFFRCDYGPYQFVKVRQAINYLIDKDSMINELFNGHGSTICGPVSSAYWMYQENEEEILERTNAYTYNPEKAVELLIEDGWVLDENGNEYVSGVRWKAVTAEEYNPWGNGEYDFGNSKGDPQSRCKQLADGRVIMPLEIEWLSYEGLAVCEVLDVQLCQSAAVSEAGFKFNRTPLSGSNFWNYLNSSLDDYFYPTYGMFTSATTLYSIFDQTYRYSTDPDMIRSNKNRIFDKELDEHTNSMLIGMDPTDDEGFAREWVEHLVRFNEILPEIALYNTESYSIYNSKIKNYNENPHYTFAYAIVEAYIE